MGFGRIKKKERVPIKEIFVSRCMEKIRRVLIVHRVFLKKEEGRIFLGMKDFLGKEVFKRREVLTNKIKKERLGRTREVFHGGR